MACNTFTQHSNSVRRNAVQLLAAAAGGAPPTSQGLRLHTSNAQADAAALFTATPLDSPRPSRRFPSQSQASHSTGGGGAAALFGAGGDGADPSANAAAESGAGGTVRAGAGAGAGSDTGGAGAGAGAGAAAESSNHDESGGGGGGDGGEPGGDESGWAPEDTWGVGDHEKAVAQWLQALFWPLFDNELRGQGVLQRSWSTPQAVLDMMSKNVAEPHMVWNDKTRCVMCVGLDLGCGLVRCWVGGLLCCCPAVAVPV